MKTPAPPRSCTPFSLPGGAALLAAAVGLCPLAAGGAPSNGALSWNAIQARIAAWRERCPRLIHQELLGKTAEGREIPVLRLSSDAARDTGKPEALLLAGVHAQEQTPQWCALKLAEELLDGYGKDPRLTRLLDERQVWLIPVLNVDGKLFDLNEKGDAREWRKNRRKNADGSFGVDLGRNFGVRWGGFRKPSPRWKTPSDRPAGPIYEGAAPSSEPETQALVQFLQARPLRAMLDLHSPLRRILYPAFTIQPEHARFEKIAKALQDGQQSPYPGLLSVPDTEPPAREREGDTGVPYAWGYYTRGIYGFNLETGLEGHYPKPAELEAEYRDNLREPLLRFLELSGELPLAQPGEVRYREATLNALPLPGAMVQWTPQVEGRAAYGVLVSEDPAVVVQSEYRLFPVKTGFTLSIMKNATPGTKVPLALYVWDRERRVTVLHPVLTVAAP